VLPEDLCQRLSLLAERESRTVSNMAKVLIQQGVQRYEAGESSAGSAKAASSPSRMDNIRSALESQQPRRLRGAPRRVRLHRPD
jgi:hypothetical protein